MDSQVYEKIKHIINTNPSLPRDEIFKIVTKTDKTITSSDKTKENKNPETTAVDLPVRAPTKINYQAFISIYSNLKRRQMFKTNMWRKLKENAFNFAQKYKDFRSKAVSEKFRNNIILDMAKDMSISPVLMTRLIVEGLLKTNSIEIIENIETTDKVKLTISNIIRDNHLLKDGRLGTEIMECCSMDEDYGPIIDTIKNLSGSEHEMKLESILREKGIAFIKESELREKGYDKTPDFKLELPIFLNKSGRVISWIDSKGTFGDETSHSEYYETQFKFYLNRFGSGLVIYWLGYVKELENKNNSIINRSIVVSDEFPCDFSVLDLGPFVENSSVNL